MMGGEAGTTFNSPPTHIQCRFLIRNAGYGSYHNHLISLFKPINQIQTPTQYVRSPLLLCHFLIILFPFTLSHIHFFLQEKGWNNNLISCPYSGGAQADNTYMKMDTSFNYIQVSFYVPYNCVFGWFNVNSFQWNG